MYKCKSTERVTVFISLILIVLTGSAIAGHAELLMDIDARSPGCMPHQFTIAGGKLFFATRNQFEGVFWMTDGTEEGTVIVKGFRDETGEGNVYRIEAVGERIFLSAAQGQGDRQLWVSDGTEEGTVKVQDADAGSMAWLPDNLTAVGDRLFFTADKDIAEIIMHQRR